jgi:hypothetical protein
MTIQLKRTHKGDVVLHVNGQPASAAKFGGIQAYPDGMHAVFLIPMQNLVLAEVDNVVPFVAPQARS